MNQPMLDISYAALRGSLALLFSLLPLFLRFLLLFLLLLQFCCMRSTQLMLIAADMETNIQCTLLFLRAACHTASCRAGAHNMQHAP